MKCLHFYVLMFNVFYTLSEIVIPEVDFDYYPELQDFYTPVKYNLTEILTGDNDDRNTNIFPSDKDRVLKNLPDFYDGITETEHEDEDNDDLHEFVNNSNNDLNISVTNSEVLNRDQMSILLEVNKNKLLPTKIEVRVPTKSRHDATDTENKLFQSKYI